VKLWPVIKRDGSTYACPFSQRMAALGNVHAIREASG